MNFANTIRDELREHYRAMLNDPGLDQERRDLAVVCLEDLEKLPVAPNSSTAANVNVDADLPAEWAHVLVDVIASMGNTILDRGREAKSGHEPLHSSSSGTCVSINREKGLWWCSSCQMGGTAVSWAIDTHSYSYTSARAWLTLHYGAPRP